MRIAAVLAAVAVLLVAPSFAAAAPTATNIGIATKASAFVSVLDVAGGSTSLGAKVIQYPVHGGANQRWDLVRRAGESVAIVNRASGLCLTTNGVAGAQLYLWTCDAANPRQSSLARAFIEVGRLEHTRFLLDLLRSPTLRHEMQASLNKGEASNNLRKAVFFNRLGQVRDRAYESQLHRARGLNLLVAAIVLWNTRYLGEAVDALRRHGHALPDESLAHVWPLQHARIIPNGTYFLGWQQEDAVEAAPV